MSIGSTADLEGMIAAGRVAARTLQAMLDAVAPGTTPADLNRIAADALHRAGARSAPMISVGFPAETCISVNDAIAHGIPSTLPLSPTDLVNIDVSVELEGFFADTGASVPVSMGCSVLDDLCAVGRLALRRALGAVRAGGPMNGVGWAAEGTARQAGYEIVRDLCGHGVGRALHEAPTEIPAYFRPGDRRRFREGMVVAIEPFVSTGARHVREGEDGWTLHTEDGGLAVQFEHTVVVTSMGALVVTANRPWLAKGEPARA